MEGNAAHWIAATVLNDMCQFGQARAIKPGMSAPNGVLITEEMMEAVEVFTDTVIDEFGTDCFPITAQSLTRLQVEQRLEITNVHPQNWGTPDVFWAVVNPGKAAYVDLWDYKHGHRFVDAFENLQLVDYVAGILNDPAVAGIDPANIKLTLGIVQPRNFHPLGPVRRWTLTAAELAPYVERLRIAAHAAMGNDPKTVVGDWCRDCSGRRGCVALQRAADAAMDLAESAAAQDLPPAALGTELRMIHRAQKLLDARATGLEEHAASLLKSGTAVPF
jgi:hypothetical protein